MFYSQFILAKKGPLATIWIAAHLERRLRKNQIAETNISDSVDSILFPEVPIALRLSGHLLLGVVRIYSRKVNYLFHDCSEALIKIRQAFQTTAVDLPPGAVVAPYDSITLPLSFDINGLEGHLSRENAGQAGSRSEFEHHVTDRDLITLHDDSNERGYARSFFIFDERISEGGNPYALDLSNEELTPGKSGISKPVSSAQHLDEGAPLTIEEDVLPPLPMEEDMDLEGMDVDNDKSNLVVYSEGNMAMDVAVSTVPILNKELEREAKALGEVSSSEDIAFHTPDGVKTMGLPDVEKLRAAPEVFGLEHLIELGDSDVHKGAPITMDKDDSIQRNANQTEVGGHTEIREETPILRAETTSLGPQRSSPMRSPEIASEEDVLGSILGRRSPNLEVMPTPVTARQDRKKRKQIFDDVMALSSSTMKKRLRSTNDMCRVRKKAPSTEYEIWMAQKDNYAEQKFQEPSIPGLCADLKVIYGLIIGGKNIISMKNSRFDHKITTVQTDQTGARSNSDSLEGPVDSAERGLEEAHKEIAEPDAKIDALSTLKAGQSASSSREKAVNLGDEPQPGEPSSLATPLPVDHVAADMIDAGELEQDVEQVEEVAVMEAPLLVSGRERDNGAADVTVMPQPDAIVGGPSVEDSRAFLQMTKPQVLGFLADPQYAGDAANEIDQGKLVEDNIGWSSRTRAVAQYLKEKFETSAMVRKLNIDQSPRLRLGELLTRRTKREAARMFFETLVLRTKDYLHVEQEACYTDIHLVPTPYLMKAVF